MENNMKIDISLELETKLISMAKEVMTQDNRGTRRPFYYVVRRPVEKFASDSQRTGKYPELKVYYDTDIYSIKEWIENMSEKPQGFWVDDDGEYIIDVKDNCTDEYKFMSLIKDEDEDIETLWMWYEDEDYTDCGTFLTKKAAQKFIDNNRHNVGDNAYTYVRYAGGNSDAELIQQLLKAIYNQGDLDNNN